MDRKTILQRYPVLISTTIVLICENCEKEYTILDWLPLGDRLTNHIRAFCGEKCKEEFWEKVPAFDMGGEEE